MIAYFAVAALALTAAALIGTVAMTVIGAGALIRQWRAARAVIDHTEAEFSDYADQAMKVVALWTTDEHEILAGRRPFQ